MNTETIQTRRSALVNERAQLAQETITLSSRMHGSGNLPNSTFQKLRERKNVVNSRIVAIEAELSTLKAENRRIHESKVIAAADAPAVEPEKLIITKLNELREKYQALATDRKITSSCRLMSSEFVQSLNSIIREAISTKN